MIIIVIVNTAAEVVDFVIVVVDYFVSRETKQLEEERKQVTSVTSCRFLLRR